MQSDEPEKGTGQPNYKGNLRITHAGISRLITLYTGSLIIGRSASCDIRISDPKVSRRHLSLDIDNDTVTVKDLNSSAGVLVDGLKVDSATVADGSKITIADTQLAFELADILPGGTDEEFFEISAGEDEPTLFESASPTDQTISYDGIQQVFTDHQEPRIAVFSDQGASEYVLKEGETLIGRGHDCDIVIADPAASRHHAMLTRHGRQIVLRDLKSKNGTFMRASRVEERALFNGVNFRIGNTFIVYKAGFSDVDIAAPLASESERRPVVVLPGIMGSELYRGDQLYWPNLRQTLGDPRTISIGYGDTLSLGGIVKEIIIIPGFYKQDAYSDLVTYLEEDLGYLSGHDLLEFPYDWRQDNRDSAEKLKHAIDTWRQDVIGLDKKFTILCHSMGALVSRYYLNCLGGDAHVDKFVALGGAHFGAPFVIQALMYGPDLLPLGIGNKNLQRAMATMPSAYQLVPPYPAAFDPAGKVMDLHAETGWVEPKYRPLLRSAWEFHQEIGQTTQVPTTCIFGYGIKTVDRIQVQKTAPDGTWQKVRFSIAPSGDDRVAERYGYLPGSEILPVRQRHGSIWNDADVKMRIKDELFGPVS